MKVKINVTAIAQDVPMYGSLVVKLPDRGKGWTEAEIKAAIEETLDGLDPIDVANQVTDFEVDWGQGTHVFDNVECELDENEIDTCGPAIDLAELTGEDQEADPVEAI